MKLSIVAFMLINMLLLSACGSNSGSGKQSDPAASSAAVSAPESDSPEAMALYKSNCIACHAADLGGRVGPNLQTIGAKRSKEELAETIGGGRRGMPAFKKKLSQNEIDQIAGWLAAKK
ncbi:c-type cytochrome [Cohnella soli]|uniref:C-type cytochrome n=1 Tax=Cohnella soli TaxID=425005 RepID=A0ABW0I1K7_9BACL